MRLSKLEERIVRSNAKYFFSQGFITEELYYKVLYWLESKDDKETQERVANWMLADITWGREVQAATLKHFWYLAPTTFIGFWLLRRIMLKRVKQLLEGE